MSDALPQGIPPGSTITNIVRSSEDQAPIELLVKLRLDPSKGDVAVIQKPPRNRLLYPYTCFVMSSAHRLYTHTVLSGPARVLMVLTEQLCTSDTIQHGTCEAHISVAAIAGLLMLRASSIYKMLVALQRDGLICRIQRNVYMVNPYLIWYGRDTTYLEQCHRWDILMPQWKEKR